MPVVKTELFKTKDTKLATLAKALAHPARIAILRTLARRNECNCGDLVEALPLAQATVSQHLKELKSVGLIKGQIDGARSCYCIDAKALEDATKLMADFLNELQACR